MTRVGHGAALMRAALVPDLLWLDGRFRPGLAVEIGSGGRIEAVARAADLPSTGAERLERRALLPGFVNGHSHAFQRLLRGRAQWRPTGVRADFWTWREVMLGVAHELSPDDVHAVSRFAFVEMLRAGITTVGEFHYLRNDPGGRPYDDPQEIAGRVVAAAREAGLRIALLDAAYARGGVEEPLTERQRRFATPTLDGYLAAVESLADRWAAEPAVTVGVAPHSVRAVPREWLGPIAAWAAGRGAVLHVHAAEQRAEVEACRAAYERGPVELLADEGALGPRLTAVHAIHVASGEIELLARAGATVCACPTTERDLGDGFLPAVQLAAAGVPIALGSDSQTVIDPLEEMRLIEYHERLRQGRRVVLGVEQDGRIEVAPALLAMATEAGARSLGVEAGRIAPGAWADLAAIDLEHPALAGWRAETLAAVLALTAPADVVTDVWVGGERKLECRRHPLDDLARSAFHAVAQRLTFHGS